MIKARIFGYISVVLSIGLLIYLTGCSWPVANRQGENVKMEKKKLRPVLDGEFWLIGGNPDLGEISAKDKQECVDHHIYQTDDGMWHLWGCIRQTAVGRILYHWESRNLTDVDWKRTGDLIRVNRDAGESINDWRGEEWIQSPFVVKEKGMYYMFYGGHGTGTDKNGNTVVGDDSNMECQMCLMTSKDGRKWDRYKNENGQSRIFTGPGETRDPCILKVDESWVMYYAGYEIINAKVMPGFYARTSKDLIHWSEPKLIHRDRSKKFGNSKWDTECPLVVKRDGYYYLFRTENYYTPVTHVFRSEDPMDFGIDDTIDQYIGLFPVAAPEIIVDKNGQEYITSNHNPKAGTMISKLKWVEEIAK